MQLNLREMLVGSPVRLRYVYRFSTSRVQHPETVAEHSYYVCFYCLMIGNWCNDHAYREESGRINVEKLLSRAIVHDMEESRSGDFPRPFKHSDLNLQQMLENASKHAMAQVTEEIFGDRYSRDAQSIMDLWVCSKDESEEGRILEFADFLSVLSFMYEEIGAGGNRSIENHVREMGAYFEKFQGRQYDFIRSLVEQASGVMEEVFPGDRRPVGPYMKGE